MNNQDYDYRYKHCDFCAVCGAALVDPKSVEIGIGPECRKKLIGPRFNPADADWPTVVANTPDEFSTYAIDTAELGASGVPTKKRQYMIAKALTHYIALARFKNTGQKHDDVMKAIKAIHAVGYHKLSDTIARRIAAVVIEYGTDTITVKTAYNDIWVAECRRIPGRKWDKRAKANRFPVASRRNVWTAIQAVYPNNFGYGPKGLFYIQ